MTIGRAPTIHPTAVIGEGVTLGDEVTVGPYAVLLGPLDVGDRVWIGPGTVIGAPPEIASLPQNAAWNGDLDHAGVVIGAGSVIRENCVIHQGSHRTTTVGPGCWILNRAYLAHDVVLGPECTISAGVSIGGHAVVMDGTNIGMNAVVHQRRVIGHRCMIGMGTAVTRDVPPFAKAYGVPLRISGTNAVGMSRAGFEDSTVQSIADAYDRGEIDPTETGSAANEFRWWADLTDRRPASFA